MPSSTNVDWAQTVGQLCASAAMELGAIGMGDVLEASEQTEMQTRLNGMLAKWSTEANLWRDWSATLTITAANSGAVTLPAEVQNVRSISQIISPTQKRLLAPWNRDEYFSIPNRAQTGRNVSAWYVQPGIDGDILRVWQVPAVDMDFEVDYNRSFYFAEGPEQTLDVPREWYEAVLYGLAARSANIFGATRLDPAAIARVDTQARITYEAMLDSDRPDSYYFEYDSPVEVR